MARTLTCPEGAFDPASETCSAPVWVEQGASALPTLTTAEGAQIGTSILLVWAVAWTWKVIARTLAQSSSNNSQE